MAIAAIALAADEPPLRMPVRDVGDGAAVRLCHVRELPGASMEGWGARWYTCTRRNDMVDFNRRARKVAVRLSPQANVSEVAPGPGYFAIGLAKLSPFRISGLDIGTTYAEIAAANAKAAGVVVDFRLGNASAMPFDDDSFDLIYCCAAFKNFAEPIKALNEMHRVLRAGSDAAILDLRKDITRWTFRGLLLKWAYPKEEWPNRAASAGAGS